MRQLQLMYIDPLLEVVAERVGSGSPVGQEQTQADGLENASEGANGNGVERSLLGDDLRDELNATGQ